MGSSLCYMLIVFPIYSKFWFTNCHSYRKLNEIGKLIRIFAGALMRVVLCSFNLHEKFKANAFPNITLPSSNKAILSNS